MESECFIRDDENWTGDSPTMLGHELAWGGGGGMKMGGDAVPTDLMTFLSRLLNQNQLLTCSLYLPTICGFHFANSDLQR